MSDKLGVPEKLDPVNKHGEIRKLKEKFEKVDEELGRAVSKLKSAFDRLKSTNCDSEEYDTAMTEYINTEDSKIQLQEESLRWAPPANEALGPCGADLRGPTVPQESILYRLVGRAGGGLCLGTGKMTCITRRRRRCWRTLT